MKEKIQSISEAYSMQPATLYVGMKLDGGRVIDKIIQEDVHIEGDPFAYYVGYDKKGNRLFEYRKGTVNVHYLLIGFNERNMKDEKTPPPEQTMKWISVKDQMPDFMVPIIFYSWSYGARIGYRGERGKKFIYFHQHASNSRYKDVTHWMPIPKPPNHETKES
jgi:hypothetical protein